MYYEKDVITIALEVFEKSSQMVPDDPFRKVVRTVLVVGERPFILREEATIVYRLCKIRRGKRGKEGGRRGSVVIVSGVGAFPLFSSVAFRYS